MAVPESAAVLADAHPVPLQANRDFKVLLVSQGVSAIGDAVSFTALPLLVLALTGSGFAMGVVGALQTLPDLVLGMVAGATADRADRKRMMFLADLGRGLLTALIPLSVFLEGPTMLVILLVAAPMSSLRSFFLAAYTSSVPALVGRSQVARANAYFEAIYSTGYIMGPAVAGILAATIGPGPTLAIDAASFLLSALALGLVRRDLRAPVDRPRLGMRSEIREGIVFVWRHPLLRPMILFWGLMSILLAPLVPALAVHVTRDLGYDAAALGALLTAYGIGTVGGSVIMSWIGRGPVALRLFGGAGVIAVALLVLGVSSAFPILLAVSLAAGVAQSVVLVTYLTVRTLQSPDALLGRVGATARTVSLGLQPLGLLAGGVLIDATSGSTTIVVLGLLLLVLSVAFLPVRALRAARAHPART